MVRQFLRRPLALIIAGDAERRVGKPDRAVGLHHKIVRRVEALAVVALSEDGDRAIVLRPGDPATPVFGGDEPTLAVARIPVGVARRGTEVVHLPGQLAPADDPVVRDVATQQIASVAEPDWSLGPAQPGGDALHRGQRKAVLFEAVVEHANSRIGIAHDVVPHVWLLSDLARDHPQHPREAGRYHQHERQGDQTEVERAGCVLHHAHNPGCHVAAQTADRIDERHPRCG